MDDPEFKNHKMTVKEVGHEFAKKGNEMLKLRLDLIRL